MVSGQLSWQSAGQAMLHGIRAAFLAVSGSGDAPGQLSWHSGDAPGQLSWQSGDAPGQLSWQSAGQVIHQGSFLGNQAMHQGSFLGIQAMHQGTRAAFLAVSRSGDAPGHHCSFLGSRLVR